MKQIISITDQDITGSTALSTTAPRIAVNAVLYDNDGNIALCCFTKFDVHSLPGGGVEGDENLQAALKREILEETGYNCNILAEIGYVHENRGEQDFTQNRYYYLAQITGQQNKPQLTDDEIANGTIIKWLPPEEALQIITNHRPTTLQQEYMKRRDIAILKESPTLCKKLINRSK
ncbi:MAG: NUDIX hydrolase [Defluviitaleaceae bacterium]|nr:NUDIX hydrolase [Defluviitaleaceae bacterium]